jgi:cell wall-associated NlpC family hydrolase
MLLLFYQSKKPVSRFIRWVTRSPYSHVGIMVHGKMYEALNSGLVVTADIEARTRLRDAVAYRYVPSHDKWAETRAVSWLNQRVGGGYSTLGFIAAGLGSLTGWKVVIALKGEYICSGLVASALQMCGYDFDEPRLETPASLALLFTPRPMVGSEGNLPDDEQVERAARRVKVG